MATWTNVPGEGLVLTDSGDSGLPVGTMLPHNVDPDHYMATGNLRIMGSTHEGTPYAIATGSASVEARNTWEDENFATNQTLSDMARGGRTGMNPWEVLARIIEIVLNDFGQSQLTSPITQSDVTRWSGRISAAPTEYKQYEVARSIRSDILRWRVQPGDIEATYGVTAGQAEDMMNPLGDIAHFKNTGEVRLHADANSVLTEDDPNKVDFGDSVDLTAEEWVLKHFPWAKDLNLGAMITAAVTEGTDTDVLIAQVRDTPQYRATFPGITDEEGRMRFLDEQSYVDQVREYRNVLIDAGSIGGREIFNPDTENPVDYATLMERGISTDELGTRLDTYRSLVNNSAHVRATFKIYANMDVSIDDLYQAVVDPEASRTLIGRYNQNVLDAEFDYSSWVANATDAALEATTETLNNLQAQGALPEGALARINSLSTEQAQGLVEALYIGEPGADRLLELDEMIEAFQFALIGGAASEQGLVAPSMERVGSFRQAGIDRAKALKGYGAFVNQGSLIESMIRRTNIQGEGEATFGQEEFENAVFLSQAPETDLLTRARQSEMAGARTPGGFATTSRGARLAQPGRGVTGVRY